MADTLRLSHPDGTLTVRLRRSTRARRLTLRVPGDGTLPIVTAPPRLPEREIVAFVRDRLDWLVAALSRVPERVAVGPGVVLPVEGVPHTITLGARAAIEARTVIVTGRPDQTAARVRGALKALARDRAIAALDHYSAELGRPYSRLTLRDTKGRWGSCTTEGAIMLSWRLILAPPSVLRYVAAHEIAHLEQMDHSPAYWAVVERLYPDWQTQRDWLKREGAALLRFEFG
ncbi:MAG: SprT family zinc-dependent metalloprotease [Pseudomonadota bacterium]